jgi:hypothetical protein
MITRLKIAGQLNHNHLFNICVYELLFFENIISLLDKEKVFFRKETNET